MILPNVSPKKRVKNAELGINISSFISGSALLKTGSDLGVSVHPASGLQILSAYSFGFVVVLQFSLYAL